MAHPLDGCYLKLDRARLHLTAFDTEARRFLATKPYVLTTEINAAGTERLHWFEPTEDPPPDLGLLIGDCVHNLRSALDHFAYQASLLAGRPSTTTAFPIFTSEADFRALRRGQVQIRQIKVEAARTLIEEVQPFQRAPHLCDRVPLAMLNELDKVDKHRLLHVARPYASAVGIDGAPVVERVRFGPFKGKSVVAAISTLIPEEDVRVEISSHLVLAFTDEHIPHTGESVAHILLTCAQAVAYVLSEAQRRGIFAPRGVIGPW